MDRNNIDLDHRIILALDVHDGKLAKTLVDQLKKEIHFFKVGLQLFLAEGFPIVKWITGRGCKVMLDLKFYDIPKTVELACKQLNNKNITFATVHGHKDILEASVTGARDYSILAVTVLTSLGNEELKEMDSPMNVEDLVERRALWAKKAGCQGVVCSPVEAARVRKAVGQKMFIVTPGIRPATHADPMDDQKRIQTPAKAIEAGADFLVIGRPITQSSDPLKTVLTIKSEIKDALKKSERRPSTSNR